MAAVKSADFAAKNSLSSIIAKYSVYNLPRIIQFLAKFRENLQYLYTSSIQVAYLQKACVARIFQQVEDVLEAQQRAIGPI